MALHGVLLVLGICMVCCSTTSPGNATEQESLVAKERHRRLIPYMTYYFSRQQFDHQPQFHQLSGGSSSYASNRVVPSGLDSYLHPSGASSSRLPFPTKSASYAPINVPRLTNSVPYPTKSTLYSTNSRPQSTQKLRYSTISAPYLSNNVPYSTNNVPYSTIDAPYSTNNVPYFPSKIAQYHANNAGGFKISPQNHYANSGGLLQYAANEDAQHRLESTSYNSIPSPTRNNNQLPSPPREVHNLAASVTPSIKTIPQVHTMSEAYFPPPTPQVRTEADSAGDTLSQILDLLRDAGHLSPEGGQPLYRATTPTPPPVQNLHEDDYEYYDDDVDIPVPKNSFVKLTPLKVPFGTSHQSFPSSEGGTPGKPGIDYPILDKIPQTTFECKSQRYKGFFGDPDTNCQVWHYCDLNGGQASFLCPNGTIFSQVGLTCDWWFNVRCESTVQLYVLNERLYKYILPATPSFPEDYSGPAVDKYLTLKFQEKEEKRKQKESLTT